MNPEKQMCVTITCERQDYLKLYQAEFVTDNLDGAFRLIRTFKPKRGYKAIKWECKEELFMV
jgi:hypothetical protein